MDNDVVETQSASSKAKRLIWLKKIERALLDILSEKILETNKTSKDFKPVHWATVEQEFLKTTGMDIKKDQFNNKLKTWKAHYLIVREIKAVLGGIVLGTMRLLMMTYGIPMLRSVILY
ncbi:hypothetical protein AMTRI_Chr13g88700 [Amborella trichopoda]